MCVKYIAHRKISDVLDSAVGDQSRTTSRAYTFFLSDQIRRGHVFARRCSPQGAWEWITFHWILFYKSVKNLDYIAEPEVMAFAVADGTFHREQNVIQITKLRWMFYPR